MAPKQTLHVTRETVSQFITLIEDSGLAETLPTVDQIKVLSLMESAYNLGLMATLGTEGTQ